MIIADSLPIVFSQLQVLYTSNRLELDFESAVEYRGLG